MFLTRKQMQTVLKWYRESYLPGCETRAGASHLCEKSPIEICVYHPPTDPGRGDDQCIFCGEPFERK